MDAEIFVGQGLLRIILETNYSQLASADTTSILYEKPDGTTGSWGATVINTTQLYYDFTGSELDQSGEWTFQSYAVFGTRPIFGLKRIKNVKDIVVVA